MKRTILLFFLILLLMSFLGHPTFSQKPEEVPFSLRNLQGKNKAVLSESLEKLLEKQGFAVKPGDEKDIYDVYIQAKKKGQNIFVTTDAVLHTCHIFFDYLLRILEIERLFEQAAELTDRMIALSKAQYEEAENEVVKEAARLNVGFFSVAKKILYPEYEVELGLESLVEKEINKLEAHEGLEFRTLLSYVENPDLYSTPYAFEDYSQYVPRGHYTRNEKFQKYFKVMMWYGRIDFKLKPGKDETSILHGKKMTLQAILMTDALMESPEAYKLWQRIYEPTVYFVGKTDDLFVDDYIKLIHKFFSDKGSIDRYWEENKLSEFIEEALELRPPKILSGAAFTDKGEFEAAVKGFRFMGQRFIPDSYMFQELVYGKKEGKVILEYTGTGKPFTMEVIPNAGPVRAFPRGLDVMAVLGSKRAIQILESEGDTEYSGYYDQLNKLKQEFQSLSPEEWKQNLYWRWLHCLLPLLEEVRDKNVPGSMKSEAWLDKELQTALSSWTELRHDTILYAKQSYTMMLASLPPSQDICCGYVEPYPEVYQRIQDMMKELRENLMELNIAVPGIPQKIRRFEEILGKLAEISRKELEGVELDEKEYELINNIGGELSSLKNFPQNIMEKITSGTDERMEIIADVHTDLNTKQVLEEGVGAPFDIFIIIEDTKGRRLCRGAVFSYYEFKHPLDDRLTDEKWQEMGEDGTRPPQPPWTKSFISDN